MLDIKAAVRTAVDYVKEFPDLIPPREIRLEETEYLDSGDWQITLSFLENPISGARSYKSFLIDSNTAAVKAMKVRALLGAR
jgi:hypothetical protein